jgi:Uma2 family endonuclease
MMSAEPFPDWLRPPAEGWTAEDLDRLPNLPPHTELIDGSLIFVSPQTIFHAWVMRLLVNGLRAAAPDGWEVWQDFTLVLGRRNRPEPDVVVTRAEARTSLRQTSFKPEDVLVAVEIVSPESVDRDREVKPRKYAAAGIRHYWRVENENDHAVVYSYELDPATAAYGLPQIHHDRIKLDHPFPVDIAIDLS